MISLALEAFKILESIVKSTGGLHAISFMILSLETFQLPCWKNFIIYLSQLTRLCLEIQRRCMRQDRNLINMLQYFPIFLYERYFSITREF